MQRGSIKIQSNSLNLRMVSAISVEFQRVVFMSALDYTMGA